MSRVDKRSTRIREMFASIAPRYDLLNHLLSASADRLWRRTLVRQLHGLDGSSRVLDVCTGTADLAIALSRRSEVVGMDFCHPMLVIARDKLRGRALVNKIVLAEGDALHLPFRPGSFDAVTIAFGVRNLEDLRQGLHEFLRVLRPGGVLAVLEFSQPVVPIFSGLFRFYLNHVIPAVGRVVSGVEGAYRYLSQSVGEFPDQQEFCHLLEGCGFEKVRYRNFTGGVAALHTGRKPGHGLSRITRISGNEAT